MDFLNPAKQWVGNRCYRNLLARPDEELPAYVESNEYEEEDAYLDEPLCDSGDYDIRQSGGGFATSFHVPQAYFGNLIGKGGTTKKRLERELDIQIDIPRRGDDGPLTVSGRSVAKVRTGRTQISLLVGQARGRQRHTHFIEIPMNAPVIRERLEVFTESVLASCSSSRGIVPEIFQQPAKLHLTLCVLKLMDDQERGVAMEAFHEAMKGSPGPLLVRAKGLNMFTDDLPSSASVVYVDVAGDPRLQTFADNFSRAMANTGLRGTQRTDNVKLHLTVMNSKWNVKEEEQEDVRRGEWKERETFDATLVFEKFRDFDFGEMTLSEVQLSIMHTVDPGTGSYEITTSAKL